MDTIKDFEAYIKQIILLTYGWEPIVTVTRPELDRIAIVIDGTSFQKAQIMGKDASNFHALKTLTRVLSQRLGYFVYIFIAPYSYEQKVKINKENSLNDEVYNRGYL